MAFEIYKLDIETLTLVKVRDFIPNIYETTSRRINRHPSTMSFPTKNYGKVDFSNIVRRLVFSCLRMSERDEHHFTKDYLSWMKPGLEQRSLTVFNFGYE